MAAKARQTVKTRQKKVPAGYSRCKNCGGDGIVRNKKTKKK